jgi:septal ring factor EnvC (AmiA/AmiB activator)
VKALRDEAQHLKFEPPANSDWWRTVGGKGATILSMTSGIATSMQNFNTSETALQQLAAHIDDLDKKNQEVERTLNSTLAELEKHANDLQTQLGEIGVPLKVISFKLSEIAPHAAHCRRHSGSDRRLDRGGPPSHDPCSRARLK